MRTIMLDGSLYKSKQELHEALKRLLSLPEYYGMNADALHDCLSENPSAVNLWVADKGIGEVALAVETVEAVFSDLGGDVKELNL